MPYNPFRQPRTESRRGSLVDIVTDDGVLAWYEDYIPRTGGGFRVVRSGGTLRGWPLSKEELDARIEHARRAAPGTPFWF